MNKFVILTLAATALVPVGAAAQTSHSTSHSSSHSASSSSARSHSGVSWQRRGHGPAMQHRGRGPGMQHRGRGMERRHGGGGNQRFIIHRRDGKMMRGGHHGINRHRNYKRIERGFAVPHTWWGPRFHVQNWGMYGFPQPMHGRRWVRYYDDALLIDHAGRVHDGRWGMNWDEYGDRWAYDDQDIPYYDGESDYYSDEEDYGYAEGEEGAYAEHRGPPPPPCAQACPPPMPGYGGHAYPHGYGAYGYGYGWMHGGMVTITETTVHAAAPQVVTETVYVKERVKTKPRRSYKRAKPRPQPGERG